MNLMLFLWLIFSIGNTLSVTNGQETSKQRFRRPQQYLESLLVEGRNMSRVIDDLKEQNEVLQSDFMEQTNLIMKLLELSFGMTLEEYEAKEMYCNTNGDFLDIKTGFCYKYKVLNDTTRTWNGCRAQCNTEGGELASIKSRHEWDVVKGLIKKSGVTNVWLGGTDEGVEGTWVWTDTSPVTFSDWLPGRPTRGTVANCMASHIDYSWRWYDAGCPAAVYALCKIPVIPLTTSPVPTYPPVTTSLLTTCPSCPTCPPVTIIPSTTTCPSCPTCPPVSTIPSTTTCPSCPTCPPVTTIPSTTTCPPCPTTIQVTCSNGYVDGNTGTCYKYKVLKDRFRNWTDSRAECQRAGGDLASIKTSEELQLVKGVLQGSGLGGVWIGGTDAAREGKWLWTDGSPVTFSDWYSGKPWYSSTSNNCIGAGSGSSRRWYDFQCSLSVYAVCKIPVSA